MMHPRTITTFSAGLYLASSVAAAPLSCQVACSAAEIPRPVLFGAEIVSLDAVEFRNQSVATLQGENVWLSYCGVNITYIHPGWNDSINVEIWLPLDNWNGRFQGTGGGGFQMSSGPLGLASAVRDGYAAVRSDGGHTADSAADWALTSPGNLNYPLLQDFAAVGLSDMTILGQAVTQSFYGEQPAYSYCNGCLTGGRQGLMLAQRYPDLYDGILAIAPAINWDTFLVTEYWPQHVMATLGVYPSPCELGAFTMAAIAACDSLDGLEDGIISDPDSCTFDPESIIGQPFNCSSTSEGIFTAAGAAVAKAAWTGPVNPYGKLEWYGLNKDATLSGLVGTVAATNTSAARGVPFPVSAEWIKWFVARDPSLVLNNITTAQFFRFLHLSRNDKMITWHGLADQLIFPNGTRDYYERVTEAVPDVQDFYRFFEAPGVAHCSGGPGPQPRNELQALVDWVEKGIAPETLLTVNATLNGVVPGPGQALPTRNICAWPKRQRYVGGDPAAAASFTCV
ncbi:feruloyl esterase B precursor [Elsinoe ampelina]|uniref:Carboxylic ester hydrolase n=1 Tax=Elsinoe ampelina TaxID=302913 RepID=A0A6A6G3T6_9PEZI|nr:feruloyl esterase B precursor [Elsinoe ampelina]